MIKVDRQHGQMSEVGDRKWIARRRFLGQVTSDKWRHA
jgi:hypothetical protein